MKTQYDRSVAESLEQGELTAAGPLRDLAADINFRGTISLEKRTLSAETISAARSILAECYTSVADGAAYRCGDGRSQAGTDELSIYQLATMEFGPQAMGAAQTIAMAYRMVREPDVKARLIDDLMSVRGVLQELGVEVAVHTDDHHAGKSEGVIGCGAVNNTPNGLRLYTEEEDDAGASELAKNIIGDEYNESRRSAHADRAALLADTYVGDAVQLTRDVTSLVGETGVQEVAGAHNEIFASVNLVPGTTLNTSLFNRRCKEELGIEIQSFGIDAWLFPLVAEKLFPGDESMKQEFLTACGDWQARPALFLTDGTVEAVVRTPHSVTASAA